MEIKYVPKKLKVLHALNLSYYAVKYISIW